MYTSPKSLGFPFRVGANPQKRGVHPRNRRADDARIAFPDGKACPACIPHQFRFACCRIVDFWRTGE